MLTQLATLMNVDAFMNKVEEISANPDPFVILFSLVFISNNCNDHQNKKIFSFPLYSLLQKLLRPENPYCISGFF